MNTKCWTCKIGPQVRGLPHGADAPMRQAVRKAYKKLTGKEPKWISSGWGSKLTDEEKAIVKG